MSRGVNKVRLIVADYANGMSLTEVSLKHGLAVSTARYHVKRAGCLRSLAQAVRLAAEKGKLGSGLRGKTRILTPEHCESIRIARLEWGEKNAKGISIKPSGYVEYTRGPNKGRSVHVVAMEERIGRRLLPDEHVHHVDGDRKNNDINNLALLTRSGHTRLHRLQEIMSGKERNRREDGTFR